MTNKAVPNLLALDASMSICSVALQYTDISTKKVNILNKTIKNTNQQAISLLSVIDLLLKTASLSLKDIDAFVLSNGPGRFTGLRIAASCIQSLAYSFNKKVILLNSLQLLAQQYVSESKRNSEHKLDFDNKTLWVCQKAYGNVYYQQRFVVKDGSIFEYKPETLLENNMIKDLDNLKIAIKNIDLDNYFLIGSAWNDVLNLLEDDKNNNNKPDIYLETINAKHSFIQANIEYKNNNLFEYYDALPVYCVNPYSKN